MPTGRRKDEDYRYFGAKSKRRKDAIVCLFVTSSFYPEITERRRLSLFRGEVEKT